MDLNLTGLATRMTVRFFTGLLAFGVVYFIDKVTKQSNEWNVKYVFVIVLIYTLFLTILDISGVY